MRSFMFEGKAYRSISDFCKEHQISYHKVQRLRRKYLRAWHDAAIAVKWLLGIEPLDYTKEPKTERYIRDYELSKMRNEMFKVRKEQRKRRHILEMLH